MLGLHVQILLIPVRHGSQIDLTVVFLGNLGMSPSGRQIPFIEGLLCDTLRCAHYNFFVYDFIILNLERRKLLRNGRHPCLFHAIRLVMHS